MTPPKIGADMPSVPETPAVAPLPTRANFDTKTGAVLPGTHSVEFRSEHKDGSAKVVGLIRVDK